MLSTEPGAGQIMLILDDRKELGTLEESIMRVISENIVPVIREYAKVGWLKEGDRIEIVYDFGCIKAGAIRTVKLTEDGRLYFICHDGKHYLHGQISKDGSEYVGIWKLG